MSKPRIKKSRLALLVGASLLCVGASAADITAVRYYEDAVSRFNNRDLKGAEIQLRNALSRDPSQLAARLLMGRVQLGLGNAQQAEEDLLMADSLGADPSVTAVPLAKARNRLGKHKELVEKLVPTAYPLDIQADLWVELGLARLYTQDVEGARVAFQRALQVVPNHAGGMIGLARIPLRKGDFTEAARLADNAVTADPSNAEAWLIKASTLHALGKYEDAARAYAQARDLDPGNSAAGLGEATALLDADQVRKASALLADLRKSFPWMPEAAYLHARTLASLGNIEEARQELAAATEMLDSLDPADLSDNPALLRLVGTIAFDNDQLERAYRSFALYLEQRPDDVAASKNLARIAMRLGKPGEARRALTPIVNAGRADAEILALLGDANRQLNDYMVAETYYREAIANFKGGPALLGRLGAAQYQQGQRQDALQTLQFLLDDAQSNTPARVALYGAMLYFAEGKLDEAEKITNGVLGKDPENLTALNLRAALAIARSDYAGANDQLTALVRDNPTFMPARYNLAKLLVLQGQYREANAELARLLSENANDTRALLESARLAVKLNDYRTAIQHYEKIRQIDPQALIPAVELVNLYMHESRPGDAMGVASALNSALPNNPYVQQTLARVLIARNELADARIVLSKAATESGYDPRLLLSTAQLQKAAGGLEDAVVTLSKLLADEPASLAARKELADTRYLLGDLDAAQQELESVLKEAPDDVFALALLGDVLLAKNRAADAVQVFARASEVRDLPELAVSRFRARVLAGEGPAALSDLQAWDKAHPDNPIVTRALAEYLHQLGRINAALPYYERLVGLLPKDAVAHNNFANLLTEIDSERALKAAQRAFELDPTDPAILDTYGWALVQIGDLETGLSHLRDAVVRNGRSAVTRYHLGVALEEYGNRGEARRQLQQALQIANDAATWTGDARQRLSRLQ